MLESLEALETSNSMTKIDGIDKFLSQEYPDLKNELIQDFNKEKIENSQKIGNLKTEFNNLTEQLNKIENLTKINETQETIANVEFQTLNLIKDAVNLLVELMQTVGIDVKKVNFEALDELKLKISKLDENIDILKNKDKEFLKTIENDKDKLTNLDIKQKEINKQIEFVKNSDVIDSINKLEKEYKLTNEDKEALLEAEKEIYEKLNKFNLNDFENQKLIVGLNNSLVDIKYQLKEEFEDIDLDYKEILTNGVIGAGIGAGVGTGAAGIGAPIGALTGFITGVSGEILKEVSIQLGVNESVAEGLQVGVDIVGGKFVGDLGKIVFKNLPETFFKDLPMRFEYMAKGILNDLKEYEFVDAKGNVIFKGKIKDIIGDETIKMPYIGSNANNVNAVGYLRDSKYFGKEFLEKYPEMISEKNKERILRGEAPRVDELWIKYHPHQKAFMEETLEHHHINNLGEAVYIPKKLHRGKMNKDILHIDNDDFFSSVKDTIDQKLGNV